MSEVSPILKNIFAKQVDFETTPDLDKLVQTFSQLYRIELFKDGLDLILTKLQEKDLRLQVKIIKGWDIAKGCYLTEQSKVFNKVLGKFSTSVKKTIILRQMTSSLIAHEMAHALEFESGLNLGEEFRQCIGLDMKNRDPQSVVLKGEIKRLMVDALKSYPQNQFISELFARYFELLSMSRDVRATGDFTTAEVMHHFVNTTNFIAQIFNPQLQGKIDEKIVQHTLTLGEKIRLEAPQQKFQERVESFQKKTQGSWSKGVKSNAMWHEGWQKHKELDDKK